MTVTHPLADGNPPDWASEWGQDKHGVFVGFTVGGVTQRLRWIVPGRFLMGSPEDEPGRFDDEGPVHEVAISEGFWLFDTPCTQALWQAVMGENPSRFQTQDRPVDTVRWDNVEVFLKRINARVPGLSLTLPTEAQWEYACRAGTQAALYNGLIDIDEDETAPALDPIAWYAGNSGGETHPVGLKAPNGWGLYDMLGNVLEWCADGLRTYEGSPKFNPIGATSIPALRGGSWNDPARRVRAAYRRWPHPDGRHGNHGFRCARGQGGAEPLLSPSSQLVERLVEEGRTAQRPTSST